MTREEAIRELETEFFFTDEEINTSRADALDMAIDSLKAWDTVIEFLGKYRDLYSNYDSAIRVKTIEDCIAIILAGLAGVENETNNKEKSTGNCN